MRHYKYDCNIDHESCAMFDLILNYKAIYLLPHGQAHLNQPQLAIWYCPSCQGSQAKPLHEPTLHQICLPAIAKFKVSPSSTLRVSGKAKSHLNIASMPLEP